MDICPNNRPETEFLNTSVIFKSDYSVISYFIDNLTYLKQTNVYKLRKKMFFFSRLESSVFMEVMETEKSWEKLRYSKILIQERFI